MSGGQYLGNDDGSCHERVLPAFFIETMFKKKQELQYNICLTIVPIKTIYSSEETIAVEATIYLLLERPYFFPLSPKGLRAF